MPLILQNKLVYLDSEIAELLYLQYIIDFIGTMIILQYVIINDIEFQYNYYIEKHLLPVDSLL